jgi:dTDP-4-dehydrorhamnose reductase
MRLLVTGREGQLARSLLERSADFPDLQLITVVRPLVDLALPGSLAHAIRELEPDLVINAAAYTNVDRAEAEPELAYRINGNAAGEAAAAARGIGAPIIQISTDYVFDGALTAPYVEDAPTNPLNVYGASKLAGEQAVRSANPDHLILRTSWVYSPFGSNFLRTMLRLAGERDEVRVVNDQRGCPTSALDLADSLLRLASLRALGRREGWGRTFHVAGSGACSWAEFATEIFRNSAAVGGPSATVFPLSSSEFPTAAVRPANSVLDTTAFFETFGFSSPLGESAIRRDTVHILAAVNG